ncbi:MAG: hypothetical protein ACYSUT_12810, partial [Planctomycetota bacterium]
MTTRSRQKGMAMLVVLFIVMAVAIISSGFIARSDAELACGRNYNVRYEVDYLAWAGLEHGRALIVSPDNASPLETWSNVSPLQLEAGSDFYYDLSISSPTITAAADPNDPSLYTYPISCQAYKETGGQVRANSSLEAALFFDPNDSTAYYIS